MSTGLDLGKQVGPLPVGGWVAVVGGGLAIAYFVNKGQARQDAQIEPLTEAGVGTGLVPAGAIIQPFQPSDDEPEDNPAWGRKVLNWLIGSGSDPATADNAVRKYLSGENLTVQENALINLALVKFGSPPGTLPPVTVPTVPPPTTPPVTPTDSGRAGLVFYQPGSPRKRGSRVPLKGYVRIGGKVPISPTNRIVTITVFYLNKPSTSSYIYQRFFLSVNSKGEFNTSTGWGISSRGWRWYQASYKGVISNRRVTFT
jgi:hypothetical protein